jgi:hypothetical protein
MNRKIIATVSILLFIGIMFPQGLALEEKEEDNPFFNYIKFAHVSIQGSGREFVLGRVFLFGFGKASVMRVRLYDDAIIKIDKLDSSDSIVLEGSQTITLWGFYGYYTHVNKININGVAMVAFWM